MSVFDSSGFMNTKLKADLNVVLRELSNAKDELTDNKIIDAYETIKNLITFVKELRDSGDQPSWNNNPLKL